MNIIVGLDQLIINFFEKTAHKLQDWTGKNNFWFSRFVIFVYLGADLVCDQFLFENKKTVSDPVFSYFGITLVISVLLIGLSYKAEQRVSTTGKFKNPLSLHLGFMTYFRIFYLTFFVVGPALRFFGDFVFDATFWSAVRSLAYIVFLYLICCTPKPPSESKIKKLLKSLFLKRELATMPS